MTYITVSYTGSYKELSVVKQNFVTDTVEVTS
jgi:hypothetical protein